MLPMVAGIEPCSKMLLAVSHSRWLNDPKISAVPAFMLPLWPVDVILRCLNSVRLEIDVDKV